MKYKRLSQIIIGAVTFGSLLFGYSNCAKQFTTSNAIVSDSEMGSSSTTSDPSTGSTLFTSGTCDQDLKLLFTNGYHTFLQNNCALCHVNGPGKGRFASPNIDDAFTDFMQIGYSK